MIEGIEKIDEAIVIRFATGTVAADALAYAERKAQVTQLPVEFDFNGFAYRVEAIR